MLCRAVGRHARGCRAPQAHARLAEQIRHGWQAEGASRREQRAGGLKTECNDLRKNSRWCQAPDARRPTRGGSRLLAARGGAWEAAWLQRQGSSPPRTEQGIFSTPYATLRCLARPGQLPPSFLALRVWEGRGSPSSQSGGGPAWPPAVGCDIPKSQSNSVNKVCLNLFRLWPRVGADPARLAWPRGALRRLWRLQCAVWSR